MSTTSIKPTITVFVSTDCDSACDEGLMRCYGNMDTQCCNFYEDSMCVESCTNPAFVVIDNICDCPVGTLGDNCENCELKVALVFNTKHHFHYSGGLW